MINGRYVCDMINSLLVEQHKTQRALSPQSKSLDTENGDFPMAA